MHWLHFKLPCNNTNFIVSNFLFCHPLSLFLPIQLSTKCVYVCVLSRRHWQIKMKVFGFCNEFDVWTAIIWTPKNWVLNDWFFVVMKLIRLCNANFPYGIFLRNLLAILWAQWDFFWIRFWGKQTKKLVLFTVTVCNCSTVLFLNSLFREKMRSLCTDCDKKKTGEEMFERKISATVEVRSS